MSALPEPTTPKPSPSPAAPELSLFVGDELAPTEPPLSGSQPLDISELLEAWQAATSRLERTHALLREEVSRLNSELEIKNRELARKNRMADLGEMASHVAHEVRNNLTPVTLYLSLLRRHLAPDHSGLDILAKVESGFTALEATVNDLLSFSANRPPQWGDFLVCSLVDELCDSLRPQFDAQGVEIELDIPPNSVLHADRELIRRAVLNLMLNALDAMPGGGQLVITSYDGAHGLEIEVADSGPGIDPSLQKRLFEPFFSTKEKGAGLGLAVVAHAAEAHGGEVTALNCPEGGAAFTIKIPRRALGAAA